MNVNNRPITLSKQEQLAIGQCVDALLVLITGDESLIDSHAQGVKTVISKMDAINNLEAEKFKLYLNAGAALNQLFISTKIAKVSWENYCEKHFSLPETTMRRWRHIAKAKIDPRYYEVGMTKLDNVVQGCRDVDKSFDVNEVLAERNFKEVAKDDCRRAAINLVRFLQASSSPAVINLGVDNDLLKAAVETDVSAKGFNHKTFVEEMKPLSESERATAIEKMVASGKKRIDKPVVQKALQATPLNVVVADFIVEFAKTHEDQLMPELLRDLELVVENYKNFNM